MNPTFRTGGLLEVTPCKFRKLRRDDVIVFTPPGENRKVTHRIVSSGPEGIRTRGDGNNRIDEYILRQENITGLVRHVKRNGRRRVVCGGAFGSFCALCARAADRILVLHNSRIAESGSHENIRVLLLKGAALSRLIYPFPGLRPFNDIDLLVPADEMEKPGPSSFTQFEARKATACNIEKFFFIFFLNPRICDYLFNFSQFLSVSSLIFSLKLLTSYLL